jgi:hypothetical protein
MADKPKQTTKNQHTVPRCCLRGFADGDQRFFRFNKLYKKSSPGGIKGSASAEYFYDLHPATLTNPADDPQWVENTFALLENRYRAVLDACIEEAKAGELSVENASYLAQFMTLQWMRTIGARKTFVEADEKFKQAEIDRWYAAHHPGMRPGKFKRGTGYETALHANLMFDYPGVIAIAEKFWNLFWIVGRNRTDQPFFTSDEPVVRDRNPPENDSPDVPPGVGIEYAFPLNSEFILVMFDRYMFSKIAAPGYEDCERKTLEFGPADVERYNALQVAKSTQYVFCLEDKFALAERLCREEPRICDPDRERSLVEITTLTRGAGPVSISIP